MLKRITKSSIENLLTKWSPEHQIAISQELASVPPFMTVQTAANIMDVSESTIRRFIHRGELITISTEGPNSSGSLERR